MRNQKGTIALPRTATQVAGLGPRTPLRRWKDLVDDEVARYAIHDVAPLLRLRSTVPMPSSLSRWLFARHVRHDLKTFNIAP